MVEPLQQRCQRQTWPGRQAQLRQLCEKQPTKDLAGRPGIAIGTGEQIDRAVSGDGGAQAEHCEDGEAPLQHAAGSGQQKQRECRQTGQRQLDGDLTVRLRQQRLGQTKPSVLQVTGSRPMNRTVLGSSSEPCNSLISAPGMTTAVPG